MERAAGEFFKKFIEIYAPSHEVYVFCGPGNNGGDGFAIARMLLDKNYNVSTFIIDIGKEVSKDFLINQKRLSESGTQNIFHLTDKTGMPKLKKGDIVIDALFGTVLSRPIEG